MDADSAEAMIAILENQVMLAETMWMILQRLGAASGQLDSISARVKATREALDQLKAKLPSQP